MLIFIRHIIETYKKSAKKIECIMTQSNDNSASAIQEAREQIEQKQYLEAINNLNNILQNNNNNGYALFLRGKAYSQLNKSLFMSLLL
jgi:Flp pilus assembly protein TadD